MRGATPISRFSLQVDSQGVPFKLCSSYSEQAQLVRLCPLDSVSWTGLSILRLLDASGHRHTLVCSCCHPQFSDLRRWLFWLKEHDVRLFNETWV
jgi:hypothetical protein